MKIVTANMPVTAILTILNIDCIKNVRKLEQLWRKIAAFYIMYLNNRKPISNTRPSWRRLHSLP